MRCNNVVALTFERGRQPLAYQPGLFVCLAPQDRGLAAAHAEEHPYTISLAPGESVLRLAIEDLGYASCALH